MEKMDLSLLNFRPITANDMEISYQVYHSTREEEMAKTGWTTEEIENFVRMQFNIQHKQYTEHYQGAKFDIIYVDKTPVGRLYLHETKKEMRIMDIAILTKFRNMGIGTKIFRDLINISDEKNKILSIHVEIYNPAIKLYERLGFEMSELRGMYYFMERKPKKQD